METTRLIELTDLGIHRQFTVPLIRGRIVELVGTNGVGKSTCIDAIRDWLGGGEVTVQRRDGSERGTLACDGSGMRRFAKQRRAFGSGPAELGFVFVEERFDMQDLIEPKLKKAEDRDAHRIKALLSLSRARIDFAEFERLIPPVIDGHQPISIEPARKADDPVRQAALVKRALEAEARRYEELASKLRAHERVAVESVKDVDARLPHDRAALQAAHEQTVTAVATLRAQQRAAEDARRARVDAERRIKEAGATYQGPSVDSASQLYAEAQQKACNARDQYSSAVAAVCAAEEALRAAQMALRGRETECRAADAEVGAAARVLEAAEDHENLVTKLTGQFAADLPKPPAAESQATAEVAKAEAEQAVLTGERVREALRKREEAAGLGKQAAANEAWAERLREAAKATDEVLSRAVQSSRLRVLGDRLLYRHEDGREEEFDRLSRGQRSIVAIQEAAKGVCEGTGDGTRILLFPQEIWEGLAPENRDAVADAVALEDICTVTGRVPERGESAELHVVVYGSQIVTFERDGRA